MKKYLSIHIFLLKKFRLVFSLLIRNMRKGKFKLSIENLVLQSEDNYANDYVIVFKQSGAFAVMIDKYVFPVYAEQGKLRVPKKLLTPSIFQVRFLGLFQSSTKHVEPHHSISRYVIGIKREKFSKRDEFKTVLLSRPKIVESNNCVKMSSYSISHFPNLKKKEVNLNMKYKKITVQNIKVDLPLAHLNEKLKLKSYE